MVKPASDNRRGFFLFTEYFIKKSDKHLTNDYRERGNVNKNITLLIGFVPNTTSEQKRDVHNSTGARLVTHFIEIDVDVVEVMNTDFHRVLNDYQACSAVSFIEDDITFPSCRSVNDQFYDQSVRTTINGYQSQWGLKRVNPEPAWERARNLEHKVIIAILDTGIDPDHPDLAAKIVQPVNFTSKNRDDYLDKEGHGTHVAGIASAVTNNHTGIAGISYNAADIMPIKVIGPKGGQTKWVIAGILYAIHNGAKVINISFGAASFSHSLQLAINYAWQRGVVIIAAAGNEGRNLVEYPAGYNFVLGVSATTETNELADFSNRGINIGITAPGTAILSTTPSYRTPSKLQYYDTLQGTSQAAPLVSGLAALLFAIDSDLTNAEMLQVIQRSANPIDEEEKQWNPYFGYGLLNAANAVQRRTGKMIRRVTNFNRKRRKASEKRNSRKRTHSRRASRRRTNNRRTYSERSQVKKGSFYGQVVDKYGKPIANAVVSAYLNGKMMAKYVTRTNVPIEDKGVHTDGIFRLQNLAPGKYNLLVELPGARAVQLGRAAVIGGADTFLQLEYKG